MTVYEYRQQHPDCAYCHHWNAHLEKCYALNKRGASKRRAKKCPCYVPAEWKYERSKNDEKNTDFV